MRSGSFSASASCCYRSLRVATSPYDLDRAVSVHALERFLLLSEDKGAGQMILEDKHVIRVQIFHENYGATLSREQLGRPGQAHTRFPPQHLAPVKIPGRCLGRGSRAGSAGTVGGRLGLVAAGTHAAPSAPAPVRPVKKGRVAYFSS
jgi:hypothetical protein